MPINVNDFVKIREGARVIQLHPLTAGERMKLFRIMPGDAAEKPLYLSMALTAAAVRQIDESPYPFPRDENDLERVLDKLGDSGVDAVQTHFVAEAEAAKIAAAAPGAPPSAEEQAGN